MNDRSLKGKVVVITGASSGFGKGAALAFAENGANVVLAARRGDLLEELARECQGSGAKALAVQTDVSRREEVERLAEAATRSLGRIDVWVNDAGVGALGRFERIPLDVHEHVIRTNLLGTLRPSSTTRPITPGMKWSRRARCTIRRTWSKPSCALRTIPKTARSSAAT